MNNRRNNGVFRNSFLYIIMFLAVIGVITFFTNGGGQSGTQEINATKFTSQLTSGKIKTYSIQPGNGVYKISGDYKKAQTVSSKAPLLGGSTTSKVTSFTTTVLTNDPVVKEIQQATKKGDATEVVKSQPSGILSNILITLVPMLILVGLFYLMMTQAGQGGGGGRGGVMNFGKSKAKPADPKSNTVRFADVAGAEEEKQELVEVVDFLKDPKKFAALGARIPAGVLLEGPPGTGKTLLAKAVAGEAGVPFYSISGSDFVEMFVGVGASRVRDLFDNAKRTSPSIIFIDEIDAIGRKRGSGMGGGNDEREQTLNQMLIEMDGFTKTDAVIVIAATNRSDVLDPALLRPGRFDRKILVGAPDVKGREAVLRVHAKNKPLAADVDLKVIAQQTPGFVGADLENLLNEAALLAARRNKQEIDASDVDEAEDRVIAGPAKKDRVISKHERETVAYHEAGHALVGMVLSNARVVHKVTIVPRGRAGGYAIVLPKEDQMLLNKDDAMDQIAGLMGGRAAEEIIFHQQSSGASNDFQQATGIARAMVTQYGMSDKVGMVQLEGGGAMFAGEQFGGNAPFSEETSRMVDEEIRRISTEGFQQAKEIIASHRDQHKAIAEALLKYETLDAKEIKSLFETGLMPAESEAQANADHSAATFEEAKAEAAKKDAEQAAQYTQPEKEANNENSTPKSPVDDSTED
ncbi:ATP-dependent zinc metalloprotease FtsH [Periweissella ghanensis]|uniref:ATP-dependent zinc metalloprotease FtsH n=1 Tax=Periweissella ghanensis TaxID=467997 RepID=A0ABM8Z9Y1_9LACO|nr:ATP-dependent zinc metalloprotease FtsH [Periweissella ghanensis]MCM0600488.1 ATP-dependent zinc metalloprotease FtsH [Periweissella ghanensis]CAH0418302.1 ATP-dependent zinc metalloprotease FtsH [Periweissella ghanensis]